MSGPAFDLFIIGAGSGGVRAARMAAQRGARVAVAEDAALVPILEAVERRAEDAARADREAEAAAAECRRAACLRDQAARHRPRPRCRT